MTFASITYVPEDKDILQITDLLISLCLSFRFNGTDTDWASGIVLKYAAFKWTQVMYISFVPMTVPLAIYNPEIKWYTDDSNL